MKNSVTIVRRGTRTFWVTSLLALAGAMVAYYTEWMIAIPFLFSLGIPLTSGSKPVKQMIGRVVLIILGTVAIFTGAVILMLNIEYSRMILQAAVVGAAGSLVMLLNGALIRAVRLSPRNVLITFFLAAASIPAGMWITETMPVTGGSFFSSFFGQYGIMILWMLLTTGGIVLSLQRSIQAR